MTYYSDHILQDQITASGAVLQDHLDNHPTGTSGGVSSTTSGVANELLPQYRMVYADSTVSGYLGLGEYDQTEAKANVFGMVTESGGISTLSTGEITLLGKITNPAWNWNPNADLWLSSSGTLTETKPTADSVYAIPCGHSLLEPTEIWLSPKTGWKIGASNISAAGPLVRGAVEGRFDRNSDTELIWTPVNGNGIGLWNGYEWRLVTPATDPTAANTATTLSGVSLAVDCLYDVFAEYVSDDEFQFVFKHWDGATAGSSDRGYSLYQHQGVYVEADTADGKKRRWLGTIYAYNESSTVNFKDDSANRLVSNYYNSVLKVLDSHNSGTSWSYAVNTWREFNGGTNQIRALFVLVVTQDVKGSQHCMNFGTSPRWDRGIGLDRTTGCDSQVLICQPGATGDYSTYGGPIFIPTVDIGYHYITQVEKATGSATVTVGSWDGVDSSAILDIHV